MIRSASASTAVASSREKNCQGPGRTGVGGLPLFGYQGSCPAISVARETAMPAKNQAAVANNCLRCMRIARQPARGWKTDPADRQYALYSTAPKVAMVIFP